MFSNCGKIGNDVLDLAISSPPYTGKLIYRVLLSFYGEAERPLD